MIRRLPVIPTLIVLAAVAVMIRLGFWQIDRMHEKERMLEQYRHALSSTHISDLGKDLLVDGPFDYTHVRLRCARPTSLDMQAGHNFKGEVGWAHVARCRYGFKLRGTPEADVTIGWSRAPVAVVWDGGDVQGTVVPSKSGLLRVVADAPLAGLEANARPDPANIPNNHWSYAVQWFLFALVALVIYGLAVRKRLADPGRAR